MILLLNSVLHTYLNAGQAGFDLLNHLVGSNLLFVGKRISIEVDVRSREKEERTIHMFANKKQSPLFFYGVPESVKIGILFVEPASIEFESFEELEESSVVDVEGGYRYKFEGEELLGGEEDECEIKI